MSQTTTITPAADGAAAGTPTKKDKAKFVETLPPEVVDCLARIKKELATPGTHLGSLVRRVQSGARTIHEGIKEFGTDAVIAKVGNSEHSVPLTTSVVIALNVRLGNGEPQVFAFAVGNDHVGPVDVDVTVPEPTIAGGNKGG